MPAKTQPHSTPIAEKPTPATAAVEGAAGSRRSMKADDEGFAECTEHGGETLALYASFDEMPLHQNLLRGIYSHGFERPSPIQQRAIVPMLRGGDIIAQAQAGTGKTGAFAVGLLQRIDFRRRELQAIVLAPTRELADQIKGDVSALGSYLAGDNERFCHLFVGGTKRSDDVKLLQATAPLVAVGTPGRLGDMIKFGALRTAAVRTLVLDEADEMLSQGFSEQVKEILSFLPKDVQVALFSATLPPEVLELSARFMRDPTRILVRQDALTLKRVRQFYIAVDEGAKLDCLMDLYESISIAQSVVFANNRRKVDWIAQHLNANHHTVSALHAELAREERTKVMAAFRAGSSRVLVTSDLVCRGIDVQHVNVVINFDVPLNKESYLHRIGRSGRSGKRGLAINFVSAKEVPLLREIEQHYKVQIPELPMDFVEYLDETD